MPHVRQQIREAAATALTGLATTSTRVYQSRVYPLRDADLPCLLISTDDETITSTSIGSLQLERALKLTVRAVAKATSSLDDTLDQILAEVEAALSGSTLGGLCKQTMPDSISVQMDDTLDKPAGVATLTYTVTYFTAGSAPGTPI
jgi:hypothetical protein